MHSRKEKDIAVVSIKKAITSVSNNAITVVIE